MDEDLPHGLRSGYKNGGSRTPVKSPQPILPCSTFYTLQLSALFEHVRQEVPAYPLELGRQMLLP